MIILATTTQTLTLSLQMARGRRRKGEETCHGGNAADVKELMALEVEGAGVHRWYRLLKLNPKSVPCHLSIF